MRLSHFSIAGAALSAFLSAQNTNEGAPVASHVLAFQNGAKIEVSYASFTIARGQTLRDLNTGKSANAAFYNDSYIPHMLAGKIAINGAVTIGGEELASGKYRFSFRIDEDAIWNLDVYTDTGKETIGQGFQIEKGWWQQEDKLVSVALDTEDTGEDAASRLMVVPAANPSDNHSKGALHVRFGPLTAAVPMKVAPPKAAAAEAAGDKGAARAGGKGPGKSK